MIDPVGSASSTGAANVTGFRSRLQDVTSAVAKELGMSTDDLEQQLSSGASLDDVAKSKGVSHDDLVATIAQALQASSGTPADGQPPTALDQLAERIAAAHPHHHGHGHHHVRGSGDGDASTTAAQAPQASQPTTSGAPGDTGIGTVLDALG